MAAGHPPRRPARSAPSRPPPSPPLVAAARESLPPHGRATGERTEWVGEGRSGERVRRAGEAAARGGQDARGGGVRARWGWGGEAAAPRRPTTSRLRAPPPGPSPGPATARTQHRSARGAQGACAHTARLRGRCEPRRPKGVRPGRAHPCRARRRVGGRALAHRRILPRCTRDGASRVATASRPHARRLSGGSDGACGVKGGQGAPFDAATVDPTAR